MSIHLKTVLYKAALLSTVLALLGFTIVLAASGDLDTTFSGDGLVTSFMLPEPDREDVVQGIAIQPNGKIVVAGYSRVPVFDPFDPEDSDFALARYNANGSLDTTFSGDGRLLLDFGAVDRANDVRVQLDGKIIVVGDACEQFGGGCDAALARYNSNGTLDTTFSGDGIQRTAFGGNYNTATGLRIQPDGKIVVSGSVVIGGNYDFAIYRYLSNGSLDTTFSGDGMVRFGFGAGRHDLAEDLAFQNTDGKIVVIGHTSNSGFSAANFALARVNPNGTLDTTFSGDGRQITDFGTSDYGYSFSGLPDGRMMVVGQTVTGGNSSIAIARYKPDGSLDTTFNLTGKKIFRVIPGFDSFATDVVIQPDKKIVVLGSTLNSSGAFDFALVRLNPGGGLDTTFSGDGKAIIDFGGADYGFSLARQPSDGKYVLGGENNVSPAGVDFALARVLP